MVSSANMLFQNAGLNMERITPDELLTSEQKTVLVFDIRSSTIILSNLAQQGYSQLYQNFHIELKNWLVSQRDETGIELYKFLGDGWILLLPHDMDGELFFNFLENLCEAFDIFYYKYLNKMDEPLTVGLTMGIDSGILYSIEMNKNKEYLGRSINLACRLQAAAKVFTESYVCLMTHRSSNGSLSRYCAQRQKKLSAHKAELRNINGGHWFDCNKLIFDFAPSTS
jgi:hypothetical protein